jgi:hypothetical protein
MVIVGVGAGCNEAPMMSEELGQSQQALCVEGDNVHAAMAALAVATATELGRWQAARDFAVVRNTLTLTSEGKRQCDDGVCPNTQGVLDLQKAGDGEVEIAGAPFYGMSFRRGLIAQHDEQRRCESRRAVDGTGCSAERHELSYQSQGAGVCNVIFTFGATTPTGGALESPAQLANKLIYAGYPENPYLDFTSTGSTVSIDPTYGLNEDGGSTAGSCSAACTKLSSVDIAGQCCTCNGATRTYSRSPFSGSVYLCS